ncbi:MAG: cytochrome c biogenesis CcdA family protein [Candidatus Kaelpia aquatica]|nr:cytochrome c biogenesis CcdA family protein [Candidatus Kaelpia aquatica]
MKNVKWYFFKTFLFLSVFLFKPSVSSAEISLTIIGEDKEMSQDFVKGLKRYLPDFNHVYYHHEDSKIRDLLKELQLSYLPVIIYDKDKLDSSDEELLKKKRLIIQEGDYSIFSPSRLHYVTTVHLLNREPAPSQLGIFAMSLCPYGQKAQWKITRFIEENDLPVELKSYFIVNMKNGQITSMRGPNEIEEDIHQLLIEEYWPQKLSNYLLLTEEMSCFEALGKAGLSYKEISNLRDKGEKLLKENMKVAQKLDIRASPTFLWENVYLISGLNKIIKILEQKKVKVDKETDSLLGRKRIPGQLGIFVMSMCSYGQRAQRQIAKFIKENNLPLDLKLYFIAEIEEGVITSMRGLDEIEEDIHQLLIQKYWPQKLYDYLLLTEEMSCFEALEKVGLSYKKINNLRERGERLLKENIKVAQEFGVSASPTFLWENTSIVSGLDEIMEILEQERVKVHEKTHPLIEYKIINLGDHESSQNILTSLEENFRLQGSFMPVDSSAAEEYIERFKVDYLPFVLIKKSNNLDLQRVLRKKLGWEEKSEGFIMPKERVLETSPAYYLNRKKEENQVDIITGRKELNKFRNSSFIKALSDSGIKVNFHKQGIFFKSELYKELSVKKLPLILWENQYLVSNFKQLLKLPEIKQKFGNLKTDRKIILDFFSSPSCHFCGIVEDKILPPIMEKYGNLLDIVEFDTSQPRKYKFLLRMEKYFDIDRPGVPKILLGGEVLTGKRDIESGLEVEILNTLFSGTQIFNDTSEPVKIDYFYNFDYIQKNKDAEYIWESFLPLIEKRYNDRVKIVKYNIREKKSFDLMFQMQKQISEKENYFTPKIFIADNLLQGADDIKQNMDLLIQEELLSSSKDQEENIFVSKISKFTLPVVIGAGLLDGVNPCAFTVIIFFVSFLVITGYRKKEMFYIGGAFIFAVFLTYLLIGLGLFAAFYRLAFYRTIFGIFRYIIIGIVFFLAGLNLYDYLIYKIKKTPKNLILQLPGRIKFLIKKIIGEGYRGQDAKSQGIIRLVVIALSVGFVVSILESVCTGQVYFPTIAFLAQLPGVMKIKALSYLFVYNLMFIIPLIAIFILGLLGVSSGQFERFLKHNLGKIKIVTAVLFFFLGYILIVLY